VRMRLHPALLGVLGPISWTLNGGFHSSETHKVIITLAGWIALPATIWYIVRPSRLSAATTAAGWAFWFASGILFAQWTYGPRGRG
jgi:hypothetical protein